MNTDEKVYLSILKQSFENRKKKHPVYSLRSFAKDLSLSPSSLSEILKDKKNISDKMAKSLAFRLELKGRDKDIFLTSASAHRIRKSTLKSKVQSKLQKLLNEKDTHFLVPQEIERVNSWVYFAIMELITFSKFDNSPQWIAKKLSMDLLTVQEHINTLLSLNWIQKVDNNYQINVQYAESTNDIPSSSIKRYHQSVLRKASDVLNQQPVEKREYQSAVLGFNKKNIKEAKKYIRDFIDQFCIKFAHEEVQDKNDVYQIALQFYSLTEEGKS